MTYVLKRAVLVLSAISALGGCAGYRPFEAQDTPAQLVQPAYRVRLAQADTAPTATSPNAVSAPPAAPPQVETRPLDPAAAPLSNPPAYVTPSTPPQTEVIPQPTPPPQPAYPTPPPPVVVQPEPPPPAPVSPRYNTVTTTSVTGKVVVVDGPPATYVVKKGDNLDAIGRKVGQERKELADRNKLSEPYRLKPGQVLKLPPVKRKAYVVSAGDTLSAIGRRFSVTAKALGAENGLKAGAALKPGQKIRLPEKYRDLGPIRTVTRTPAPGAPPTPEYARPTPVAPPPQAPQPYPVRPPFVAPPPSPAAPPPAPRPAVAPSPTPMVTTPLTDAQISILGRGRFIWPVRGDIILTFGPKGTGQRSDGVNIRGAAGDPVRAAAAGDVAYAGDQVPGFGNLVLVKHADGWVTAYGHLARTDVKMQQKIEQGQQLGQVGSSGGIGEPQLHFEVRYAPTPTERARPVDPTLVLPK